MPFPFLFVVLTLAAGILLAFLFPLSPLILILAVLICLIGAWFIFFSIRSLKLAFLFILLTTFFLGSLLYTHRNQEFEKNRLHRLALSSYADFYGSLYKSRSKGLDKDFLFLRVNKISYEKKEEEVQGNMRISILQSDQAFLPHNFFVGDRIKVSAKLSPLKTYRNSAFSLQNMFLKSQNIHNRAFAKSPLLVEKIKSGSPYSPLRLISLIRQNLQEKIEKHFNSSQTQFLTSQGAVLEALLLGERGRLDSSITQSLQRAGIYHLFAISGAHIAIISFLLFSFFKILRIPTRSSYLILIFFLIFYAFLVEGRPSVIRATVMTLAFLLGKLLWKDVNLINTVSFSAFLLLLVNPFHLFSLGFLLTFAATFSIILFYPRIIKFLPAIPLRISDIFAITLAAQLGVLPIIAAAFNRITFSSLLLNFAALPLVGLIMACGYIFLPLSFLNLFLSQWLEKALTFLINLLISISHLFDQFSFLSYRIPTPYWITIILYYSFFLFILVPLKTNRKKIFTTACFLIILFVLITYPFPSLSKSLKITFMDVNQGESFLIEFPGRKKMLVDGGGQFQGTFDIGERIVSPFLWKKGIKKIDYLVLTHAHPDHLNGLKSVVRNFKVGEFWEAYSPREDKNYLAFKSLLRPLVPEKRMFRGNSCLIGDVKIEVLHPPGGNFEVNTAHNDQSMVLRLTYRQSSFLFTGDIGSQVEEEILNSAKEIRSQLLKSPHHGSKSSSSMAFLKKVAPQIVVISVGEQNIYGFPDQDVLERYKELGIKIFRTDHHGAIEASSDGHEIFVKTVVNKNPES